MQTKVSIPHNVNQVNYLYPHSPLYWYYYLNFRGRWDIQSPARSDVPWHHLQCTGRWESAG